MVSGFRCGIKTVMQKWAKSVFNAASISTYLGFNACIPVQGITVD